jgi:DNA polymerase III epsilon subunit-like protein
VIIVYDTETTGLTLHPDAPLNKQPRMIEFGAALLDERGEVVETESIIIDPLEPLTPEITRITGLRDEDCAGQPPFIEALPRIRRIFSRAHTVIAHNLPFDKAILWGELARTDFRDFPWPGEELCTVGLYREAWGRNPKLTELYEAVKGEPLAQTHRALDDVMALVEVIREEELWRLARGAKG